MSHCIFMCPSNTLNDAYDRTFSGGRHGMDYIQLQSCMQMNKEWLQVTSMLILQTRMIGSSTLIQYVHTWYWNVLHLLPHM